MDSAEIARYFICPNCKGKIEKPPQLWLAARAAHAGGKTIIMHETQTDSLPCPFCRSQISEEDIINGKFDPPDVKLSSSAYLVIGLLGAAAFVVGTIQDSVGLGLFYGVLSASIGWWIAGAAGLVRLKAKSQSSRR